jgi:hypothetical protein
MLKADDMGDDCIVEVAVVAGGNGDGDAFALVVNLDDYLGRLEVLDLLFY